MSTDRTVYDGTYTVANGGVAINVNGWSLPRLRAHITRMKNGDTVSVAARSERDLPEGVYPY